MVQDGKSLLPEGVIGVDGQFERGQTVRLLAPDRSEITWGITHYDASDKVKLFVFAFNKAAIGCYKKIGFKTEGILRQEIYRTGKYHDVLAMGLLRSEWKRKRTKRGKV